MCAEELMRCSGEPRNDSVNQQSTLNSQQTSAATDQDGCGGEGEGGEDFQPIAADVSELRTERAESPKENSPGQPVRLMRSVNPNSSQQIVFKGLRFSCFTPSSRWSVSCLAAFLLTGRVYARSAKAQRKTWRLCTFAAFRYRILPRFQGLGILWTVDPARRS